MGTFLWIVVATLVAALWVLGVVDIFRRRLGTKRTVAWLLIVLIVPVLGTIVYWLLREPDADELEHAEAAQRDVRHQRHERPIDGTGFGV